MVKQMLNINQTYKTKSGMTVKIEHDKGDRFYPFFGKILSADGHLYRIAYYTFDGKYNRDSESENDLILI